MGINGPCFNCEKRQLLCHDNCADYKKYKEQKSKINKIRKQYLDSLCPAFIAAGHKSKSCMSKFNQKGIIK